MDAYLFALLTSTEVVLANKDRVRSLIGVQGIRPWNFDLNPLNPDQKNVESVIRKRAHACPGDLGAVGRDWWIQ